MLLFNLKSSFLFHSWQRRASYFKGKAQQENRQNQIKSFPSHPGTLAKHQLDEFTVNESETHGLDFRLKVQRRKQEGVDFTEQLAIPALLCQLSKRSACPRAPQTPSFSGLHSHFSFECVLLQRIDAIKWP